MNDITQDTAVKPGLAGATRAFAALVALHPELARKDVDELGAETASDTITDLIVGLLHLAYRNGADAPVITAAAQIHFAAEAPFCAWIGHKPIEDAALGNPCTDCGRTLTWDGTDWKAAA